MNFFFTNKLMNSFHIIISLIKIFESLLLCNESLNDIRRILKVFVLPYKSQRKEMCN